jgi:hypothetical protein
MAAAALGWLAMAVMADVTVMADLAVATTAVAVVDYEEEAEHPHLIRHDRSGNEY